MGVRYAYRRGVRYVQINTSRFDRYKSFGALFEKFSQGGPVRVREGRPVRVREGGGSGTRKRGGDGTFKFRCHFAIVVVVPLGGERPCTSAGLRQPAQRNRTQRDKKLQFKNSWFP